MEAMTAGGGAEPGSSVPSAASVTSVAGEGVEAVRAKVARMMMKVPGRELGRESGGAIDLARVGYGLVSATSSAVTHSTMLVDAEDWSKLGCVVSRSRRKRGCKTGYLRAELADGRAYEAFAPREREGVTVFLRDGVVIGWWSVPVFTCEGRMGMPLARELWVAGEGAGVGPSGGTGSGGRLGPRRVGVIDTANLLGGCAVLELDPDGDLCVPLRVKSPGLIEGNPLKEVWKMMPFGRMLGQELGPRAANLDRVLTRQAGHLGADEMELVFAASLALRAMECVQISSD